MALSGWRTIDHPFLMLACLGWALIAIVAVFYLGMLPASSAQLRRQSRLQVALFLSFLIAIGAFFALGITGVHNVPA